MASNGSCIDQATFQSAVDAALASAAAQADAARKVLQVWSTSEVILLPFAGLIYGLFLLLSLASFYLIFTQARSSPLRHVNHLVLIGLMLLVSTAALALETRAVLDIFVYKFGELTAVSVSPVVTALLASCFVQEAIADGLLLYRVYVAYQSLLAPLPGLAIYLSNIACALRIIELQAIKPNASFVFDTPTYRWTVSYVVLSLAQNILSSLLLLYRIYTVARPSKSLFRYKLALLSIVESGSVYAIWWIVVLIAFILKSPVNIIFFYTFPHVAGCVVAGVVVQILFSATMRDMQPSTQSISLSHARRGQRSQVDTELSYPMSGIVVRTETKQVSDFDGGDSKTDLSSPSSRSPK